MRCRHPARLLRRGAAGAEPAWPYCWLAVVLGARLLLARPGFWCCLAALMSTLTSLLLLATTIQAALPGPGSAPAPSPSPGCQLPGQTFLQVVELAYSDTPVVIGSGTDNRGDGLTFANVVMDAANSTAIGSDQGYCSRTVTGAAYHCHFTVTFDGAEDSHQEDAASVPNQLVLMGPFYDKPRGPDHNLGVMAVVGGTGRYQTSRGQMTLIPRPSAAPKVEYFFNFCLSHGP